MRVRHGQLTDELLADIRGGPIAQQRAIAEQRHALQVQIIHRARDREHRARQIACVHCGEERLRVCVLAIAQHGDLAQRSDEIIERPEQVPEYARLLCGRPGDGQQRTRGALSIDGGAGVR